MQMNKEDIAVIHRLAPTWVAVKDAPNSFKDLKRWHRDNKYRLESIPVYTGGCDHTIYGKPENNYAFRAWHDAVHLRHNLSFSFKDEVKVAEEQIRQARMHGMSEEGIALLWIDVFGQVAYYKKYKEYVKDQKGFVSCAYYNGIEAAIERRW